MVFVKHVRYFLQTFPPGSILQGQWNLLWTLFLDSPVDVAIHNARLYLQAFDDDKTQVPEEWIQLENMGTKVHTFMELVALRQKMTTHSVAPRRASKNQAPLSRHCTQQHVGFYSRYSLTILWSRRNPRRWSCRRPSVQSERGCLETKAPRKEPSS